LELGHLDKKEMLALVMEKYQEVNKTISAILSGDNSFKRH